MKYFMSTERLGFRVWREEDFGLALGLWGDAEVTKLIDARGKLSDEQVRERLNKEIVNTKEYGVQYWPIFLLETGEHVGCCGLRPYDLPKLIYALGFHLRPAHWRRGYALEAARAVVTYAFGALGAKALFAGHNPKNEPSRNILLKLGFHHTHDEFYELMGQYHPSYILHADEQTSGKQLTGA
jgi:[ribosomal protein S5]-alanine N-acetyltransferase